MLMLDATTSFRTGRSAIACKSTAVPSAFAEVYSSVHRGTGYKSRASTEAYERAREHVARFLNIDERAQVVIFVKGTTDALNRIAAEEARLDGRRVLVTEMEHHADLLPWRHAQAVRTHWQKGRLRPVHGDERPVRLAREDR